MAYGQQGMSVGNAPPLSTPGPQPSVAVPNVNVSTGSVDPNMQRLPIRAYLDQTVVPILLDGMYGSFLVDWLCSPNAHSLPFVRSFHRNRPQECPNS